MRVLAKGSPEAMAWARRMKKARMAKKIREAGKRTEQVYFGKGGPLEIRPLGKNPGARWHEQAAQVAGRYKRQAPTKTEKHFFAGMERAHEDSASASRKLGINPKKRMRKNPIAVYNPPKVAGVIYNKAIEIRAQKTDRLSGFYRHQFGPNVKILGLDNGDVLIHHMKGKRLWITRKDYERSGKRHQ